MTKKEDMKGKSDAELTKLLAETRGTLREVRFAAAGSRPADASAPKKLRATIARVLTERSARAKGPAAPAAA